MTEAAYIDTSCLLKLITREPETARVQRLVEGEDEIVVSALTDVEMRARFLGLRRGGSVGHVNYRAFIRRFEAIVALDPFRLQPLSGAVFADAAEQLKERGVVHCRSLDRLHLAAMRTLGLSRLITSDVQQARAARSLGIDVIEP